MTFLQIYLTGLAVIIAMMILLWIMSTLIRNVSIVDLFWGFGFVLVGLVYFLQTEGLAIRRIVILTMVVLWGLRLSIFLTWRNHGKGEDFRYQKFRKEYGEGNYWWFSFFQVFLLQGVLMWLVSAPLLGSQFYGAGHNFGVLDFIGIFLWIIGFVFETGGDLQLARFKAEPSNKGKVLDKGFWRYTRHPNYFGDAAVWCGFGFFSLAAGSYIPVFGSLLMIYLIIRISGVALLEKSLIDTKPEYKEYIEKTSAFIPWFPKK